MLLPPASSPAGPGLAHFGRAGVLQQGLLLELPSGAGNRLQVSLEGHEGLLPKLDLFWLIRCAGAGCGRQDGRYCTSFHVCSVLCKAAEVCVQRNA